MHLHLASNIEQYRYYTRRKVWIFIGGSRGGILIRSRGNNNGRARGNHRRAVETRSDHIASRLLHVHARSHIYCITFYTPRGAITTSKNANRKNAVHVPLSLPGTPCDDPTKRRTDRSKCILASMSSWMPIAISFPQPSLIHRIFTGVWEKPKTTCNPPINRRPWRRDRDQRSREIKRSADAGPPAGSWRMFARSRAPRANLLSKIAGRDTAHQLCTIEYITRIGTRQIGFSSFFFFCYV